MTPNIKINLHDHKNLKGQVTIIQSNLVLLVRISVFSFCPTMEGPSCCHLEEKKDQLYEQSLTQSQDRSYIQLKFVFVSASS